MRILAISVLVVVIIVLIYLIWRFIINLASREASEPEIDMFVILLVAVGTTLSAWWILNDLKEKPVYRMIPVGKLQSVKVEKGFWGDTSIITLEDDLNIQVEGSFTQWKKGMEVTRPEIQGEKKVCLESMCRNIKD